MKNCVYVTGIIVTILAWILTSPARSQSSSDPGRLVFTDYPKPNNIFTVDVFDLEQNTRSSLSRTAYDDMGFVAPIDKQHVYVSMCFAQNNPLFCSAYVRAIIDPEQVERFDAIKSVWGENYSSPVWSPDGMHIAFAIASEGFEWDIYLMDADGTKIRDLAPDEKHTGFYFSWSPDSRRLAFACHDEQDICIAGADGTQVQQITISQNARVRDLAWSPDGSQIAFSLLSTDFYNSTIYVVNADGSNMMRLLDPAPNLHQSPLWSPDSSKIAFRSGEQRNNIGEIYVIDRDGTNLQNLSQSLDGNEFAHTWSPDSSQVAFFSNQYKQGMFLYIAYADGTQVQQLTDNSTWELTDVGSPELFWLP